MNSKLYLSENHFIFLPKGWFYTVIGIEQKNTYFIPENILLKSNIQKNNLTLVVQNKNNKGVIRFFSQKDESFLVKNPYYTEHNGSNCNYKIYYKESKMDEIYIPKKSSILKFQNYNDENVPKFINDFCKEG